MKTFGEVEVGDIVYLYNDYDKHICQFFVEGTYINPNRENVLTLRDETIKTDVLIFPHEKSSTDITLGGLALTTDKNRIHKIKRDITAETNRRFRKLTHI